MNTMNDISLFDLAPDIEGIIVKELCVLWKFRECVKEFKGIVSNPDTKSRYETSPDPWIHERPTLTSENFQYNYMWHRYPSGYWAKFLESRSEKCIQNAWSSLRKYWPDVAYYQVANIHGFKFGRWGEGGMCVRRVLDCTHNELNAKLHELGATGYKSKRKDKKIKILMSY